MYRQLCYNMGSISLMNETGSYGIKGDVPRVSTKLESVLERLIRVNERFISIELDIESTIKKFAPFSLYNDSKVSAGDREMPNTMGDVINENLDILNANLDKLDNINKALKDII